MKKTKHLNEDKIKIFSELLSTTQIKLFYIVQNQKAKILLQIIIRFHRTMVSVTSLVLTPTSGF